MTAETPTPLTDALIEQLNIEPWLSLSTKCAELEAHARQCERRCAELERKNAEVMLTDQGRLRSKLASYEGQLAELRRDRERLDWLNTLTHIIDKGHGDYRFTAYPGHIRELCDLGIKQDAAIDAAIRDSKTENENEEEQS